MKLATLAQSRVAVLGLGLEGQAVLTTLSQQLPELTVDVYCEQPPAAAPALPACGRGTISRLCIGPFEQAGLSRYDVLIKSPGVSLYHPAVQAARAAGVTITSGSNIWFSERAGERVVAITGTKGKSTTAALTAHLLRAGGIDTQLAGNIGVPLISLLDTKASVWVLELSSFQIADLAAELELVVLLSLFDEHLDWHRSASQYRSDELRLLTLAQRQVLVADALLSQLSQTGLALSVPVQGFGASSSGWAPHRNGWQHADGRSLSATGFALRGLHNFTNSCAALAVADYFDLDLHTIQRALPTFIPLPHRLQTVAANAHYTFINDSIATTPLATVMAMQALAGERVCLIAGGFDRGLGWDVLLDAMQQCPPYAVYGLPDTGMALVTGYQARLRAAGLPLPPGGVQSVSGLEEVFQRLPRQPGQALTVLLSPGAASFSQFRNFEQRGARFAALARALIAGP